MTIQQWMADQAAVKMREAAAELYAESQEFEARLARADDPRLARETCWTLVIGAFGVALIAVSLWSLR